MDSPFVEQAIERVVKITRFVKKAELARRAGVPESTLRDLGNADWTPNAATPRKLEQATIDIERERNPAAEGLPPKADTELIAPRTVVA